MGDNSQGQGKKKLLIVISNDLFIRNYITTDALSLLEDEYDCTFLVSRKISNLDKLKTYTNIRFYDFNNDQSALHYKIFNLLMSHYRNKSKSFKFREQRGLQIDFNFEGNPSAPVWLIKAAIRYCKWLVLKALKFSYRNYLVFYTYFTYLKSGLVENPEINSAIDEIKPDLVLFPSTAFDPDGNDLLRICNRKKVQSLFLVDNWDNLSSKTILWIKPDYIAVWGEQSKEHACQIQGFEPSRITSIGTPRFDEYFQTRDTRLPSLFNYKYILFVGTALAFDEAGALLKLDEIINSNREVLGDLKIVYRPHPWRGGTDSIEGMDLKNVVIDPQMEESYLKRKNSVDFQPSISYYPALLHNSEFVIGGLTSMLIETLIFRKRFLALAYDDGINFTNQYNVFKNYTHFEGLDHVEAISFCYDLRELDGVLMNMYQRRNDVDPELVDSERMYYYYSDDRRYKERLRDLCRNLIAY